jgi:serine/threonine protein kinase
MASSSFGRYQIIRQLGRGGMATVYHARDPQFKRDVAIKVLPAEFLHETTFRARFEQEAQTIAALEHHAIVPVYDFGEQDGQPYLVMRYMGGGSLTERIRPGPLPGGQIGQVLERIASALEVAHRAGIIHRDIKPANILFDAHDYAYLSDFGIVKLTESTAQLTGSGFVGTPFYMAPEMSEPGGLSPLVDVYALGVTLYQMLTGRLPYEADTPLGVIMAHATKPIPDVRAHRPDLTEAMQLVILKAMAKEPANRYQSATALAEGFKAALEGKTVERPRAVQPPVSTLVEQAPPPPEEPPATRRAPADATPPLPPVEPPPSSPPRQKERRFPAALVGIGALVALGCLAVGVLLALRAINQGGGQPPDVAEETPEEQTGGVEQDTPIPPPTDASLQPTPTGAPPAATTVPTPVPTPTSAIPAVEINPYCEFYGESPVRIASGTPVILRWAWTASEERLLQDHIEAGHYRILLDGREVEAQEMTGTYISEDGWPAVAWLADVGVLSDGEHLAERYLSWSRQITDGWDTFGPGGEIETEHDTCRIIVE